MILIAIFCIGFLIYNEDLFLIEDIGVLLIEDIGVLLLDKLFTLTVILITLILWNSSRITTCLQLK